MTNQSVPLMKSKIRVQKHGEVFTPQWVVDKMTAIPGIREKTEDVFATFLEPSCGEGAFLLAIENLKLQHVTKNYSKDKWDSHALWALSSIYGIEILEDNLAIARQNMLNMFVEQYEHVHGVSLSKQTDVYKSAQAIIRANIVQGDALTHKNQQGEEITFIHWGRVSDVPNRVHRTSFTYSSLLIDDGFEGGYVQASLFEMPEQPSANSILASESATEEIEQVWLVGEKKKISKKHRFDVVIGNPPYQEETKDTSDKPIYHLFMDEAFKIAERVSFITPARFLFNAGKTPKAWNQKMLNDEHLKVVHYEQDAKRVFPKNLFEGGVAVTYRDASANYGAIGQYTAYPELNSILQKVRRKKEQSIDTSLYLQSKFNLDELYKDYPEFRTLIGSGGREKRLTTSIFENLDKVFTNEKCSDDDLVILGLFKTRRTRLFIPRKYVEPAINIDKHKVLIPKSNGASGTLSEDSARIISTPELGEPSMGFTQSFIGVGAFDTLDEAEAAFRYVKSKFARVMLGVLKVTQDNPPEKWKYVPLQDFTSDSDIDWTKSIPEIDRQLYDKYGLYETETAFIESHIEEMK